MTFKYNTKQEYYWWMQGCSAQSFLEKALLAVEAINSG